MTAFGVWSQKPLWVLCLGPDASIFGYWDPLGKEREAENSSPGIKVRGSDTPLHGMDYCPGILS